MLSLAEFVKLNDTFGELNEQQILLYIRDPYFESKLKKKGTVVPGQTGQMACPFSPFPVVAEN